MTTNGSPSELRNVSRTNPERAETPSAPYGNLAPMKRRQFIAGLAGAVAAWPIAAHAQQPSTPVIGFLNSASPDRYAKYVAAFRAGLNEIGYVEGRNVVIEYRWADGQYDHLPELATDLVRQHVSVIAANSPAAGAAKRATTTIPIVFTSAIDPVQVGLVASLNRPGGNLTGISILNVELGQKRLELLHELLPTTRVMALLANPTNPATEALTRSVQLAADALGLQLHVLSASDDSNLDQAFATLAQIGAGGLLIGTDAFFITRSEQLAALAFRNAVPAIFQFREFAAAGGLMSYGTSLSDAYHQSGVYTARVLKGEKPADLPVHQSTKVELIVNLTTAKALGFNVPLSLLARADEVIE
jgi:putative tryptophan/tyrosine transport system substrate-binding protein